MDDEKMASVLVCVGDGKMIPSRSRRLIKLQADHMRICMAVTKMAQTSSLSMTNVQTSGALTCLDQEMVALFQILFIMA
jgi:hypothetical protein